MSNTEEATLAATQSQRPPFYRDATVVKWLAQVLALLLVLFAMYFLATQASNNLEARDIDTGYGFLGIDPGSKVSSGIDTDPNTGGRALWVGMVNTLRLSIGGILVATVLGVLVGVGRLSSNWIVKRISSVFIETLRNIPLVVQIILIFVVIASLPRVAATGEPNTRLAACVRQGRVDPARLPERRLLPVDGLRPDRRRGGLVRDAGPGAPARCDGAVTPTRC